MEKGLYYTMRYVQSFRSERLARFPKMKTVRVVMRSDGINMSSL